jgi:polysaccharide export outer membrane protein
MPKGLIELLARARHLYGRGIVAVLAITVGFFPILDAAGQSSPDQFQQLQQGQQLQQLQQQFGRGQAGSNPGDLPPSIVLQPAVSSAEALPQSRLEQILSSRAGSALRQFGYDQLGRGSAVTIPQTGAVQDDYILGPGDEITISLRGQENNEFRAVVDRNGQVVLPRLPPVSASGRSFGSFRQDLESAVHRAYVATQAAVSIGRVRPISVLVSGEVNVPGQRLVTGLSSAMDALQLSGGVKKTGSLRNIRIQRAGREYSVDLYSILTDRGGASAMRLTDGDRILVPPLGRTVAITGLVRRPGIFELPPGNSTISTKALLALAGGPEVRGNFRYSILRILPDGRTDLVALQSAGAILHDSEILFVQPGVDQTASQATLAGGTGLAGSYPIVQGAKLSTVLKSPGSLGPSPYTLFGIISRRDPRTLLRTLSAFTPVSVLHGLEDQDLQSDDIIRPISVAETRMLAAAVQDYADKVASQREALRNPLANVDVNAVGRQQVASAAAQQSANGAGRREAENANISEIVNLKNPNNQYPAADGSRMGPAFQSEQADQNTRSQGEASSSLNFQTESVEQGGFASNLEAPNVAALARQLGVDQLVLLNFLTDLQVTMEGAVRGPGTYFVGPTVTLVDLVQAAGGTVNWGDESGVELITTLADKHAGRSETHVLNLPLREGGLASYVVKPRDSFRFNSVFSDTQIGSVTVQGELRFPGTYKITRGERLSSLLSRAGGLTNVSYPYGTVFLRKSIAALEHDNYERAAKEVNDQLLVAMTRVGNDKLSPDTFVAMQHFVTELRGQRAVGRMSIIADPSVLASKPSLDPLLEAGDVIYIPQRPSTISVLGQVAQPGSFPYQPGQDIVEYIANAGGYASNADKSETFVVLPDGTARKIERSWLSFDARNLPPGSAIVVPRDITPLDLRQTIIDVSQILSQFAVSIASVAVLSK